jgi:Fic family protein
MIPNSAEINQITSWKLEQINPNKTLYFAMAKKDKIDYVYNTSALEGNAMTYPEVETLLDGITVGGHKLSDEQQILNQNKSIEHLFNSIETGHFKLDLDTFTTLHALVAKEEALEWGVLRSGQVNIGGTDYEVPAAHKLKQIFEKGVDEIEKIKNPILKSFTFFLFGAKNQFFYDGNKRTSRLMMNGILLDSGLPILNIKAKDKLALNTEMLDFYNHENTAKALSFFVDYYYHQNRKFFNYEPSLGA